ncbi:rRNA maturation RNase YbeY [candidate division WOR-3 bacterium]|nr:rRNA maturation RNase YbeY [candidate division WOR-3 bacterium]
MKASVLGTADRRLVAEVKHLARRVGRDLEQSRATVNVVFVSNRYIHTLNNRYLKRDRPTDVLSFSLDPLIPRPLDPSPLGEIYISRDQARIQAREYGVSYRSELKRLVLHGLLHLCGLTHRQMKPFEARYLQVPGFDPWFLPPGL